MKKKWIKFDGRPDFAPLYFLNTQEGIKSLHEWWHRNWLIGCRPKLTYVNKLPTTT